MSQNMDFAEVIMYFWQRFAAFSNSPLLLHPWYEAAGYTSASSLHNQPKLKQILTKNDSPWGLGVSLNTPQSTDGAVTADLRFAKTSIPAAHQY